MDYTLDIFNDNYFENDYDFDIAEEALGTGAKKALAGILGGPLGGLIANIVHSSKVNKSAVVDYNQLVDSGLPEKKAASECERAVNFLISKGFLDESHKGAKTVKFADLTKEGKTFMKGYYSVMDKVTHFNYEQAMAKSGKGVNYEVIGQAVPGALHTVSKARCLSASLQVIKDAGTAIASGGLVEDEIVAAGLVGTVGTVFAAMAIPGLVLSVVNIGASIKTAMNASYFKKNMSAQECAFIAQFPDELLSDFGRMLKSDCMESAYGNAFESGYANALLDMGIDPADVANESIDDVDYAFESGYAQAMNDMGYEYDTAMESDTKIKTIGAGVLGSSIGGAIYNYIHKSHIEQSNVLDLNSMIEHGMPKDQAQKEYSKAVNFFKTKGFLPKDTEVGNVVRYEMLTPRGQKYMQGFYDKMDDITPFTLQKAIDAKRKTDSTAYDWHKPLIIYHAIQSALTLYFPVALIGTVIEYKQTENFKENREIFDRTKLDD